MRRYFGKEHGLNWICLLMLGLLTACSMTAAENPFACPHEVQLDVQSPDSWFSPDCSCITSVTQGPSWQGLTIGESDLEAVRQTLGVEGTKDGSNGGWIFQEFETSLSWFHAEACFVDEKLSVFETAIDETTVRKTPEQIVELYGKPSEVTWGPDYRSRTLIWPEMGFAVFMDINGKASGQILLFPPMPPNALETSWLMMSLPTESVGARPPDVDYGSILEKEDPWGIEK